MSLDFMMIYVKEVSSNIGGHSSRPPPLFKEGGLEILAVKQKGGWKKGGAQYKREYLF